MKQVEIIATSAKIVFGSIGYVFLAFVLFSVLLLFAIWLPNFSFLKQVAISLDYTPTVKMNLFLATLGGLKTNFTPLSRILTIAVSFLFGINSAMLVFHLRRRIVSEKSLGAGVAGTLMGMLGVGCASCGSAVLTAFFGLGATAGFVGLLPLKGAEFGIIGVLLLTLSIFLAARKIKDPLVCGADIDKLTLAKNNHRKN